MTTCPKVCKFLKTLYENSNIYLIDVLIHLCLALEKRTAKVEDIILYSRKNKEVKSNGKSFKKMRNLRVLIAGDTHFSIGPKHLPNNSRVLD